MATPHWKFLSTINWIAGTCRTAARLRNAVWRVANAHDARSKHLAFDERATKTPRPPTRPRRERLRRSIATAQHTLNTVAIGPAENRRLDLATTTVDLRPGTPCCFVEVSPRYYHDYVGFARLVLRGKHFPLYQIIWPSNDGYYPWSPGASEPFKVWQPVLGEAPKSV